jgi:hypothetical protein
MYADDNSDNLPPPLFDPDRLPASGPWEGYQVFLGVSGQPADMSQPYNLGYLYTSAYISTPKTYYCPSLRHPDSIPIKFDMKYYQSSEVPWPMVFDNRVRTTYMYYPQTDVLSSQPEEAEFGWVMTARKHTQLSSQRSTITDLIYTRATLPHTTSNNPLGLNAMWGDGHVTFSTTKAAFAPELWDAGEHHVAGENPGDNPAKFRTIVAMLRP